MNRSENMKKTAVAAGSAFLTLFLARFALLNIYLFYQHMMVLPDTNQFLSTNNTGNPTTTNNTTATNTTQKNSVANKSQQQQQQQPKKIVHEKIEYVTKRIEKVRTELTQDQLKRIHDEFQQQQQQQQQQQYEGSPSNIWKMADTAAFSYSKLFEELESATEELKETSQKVEERISYLDDELERLEDEIGFFEEEYGFVLSALVPPEDKTKERQMDDDDEEEEEESLELEEFKERYIPALTYILSTDKPYSKMVGMDQETDMDETFEEVIDELEFLKQKISGNLVEDDDYYDDDHSIASMSNLVQALDSIGIIPKEGGDDAMSKEKQQQCESIIAKDDNDEDEDSTDMENEDGDKDDNDNNNIATLTDLNDTINHLQNSLQSAITEKDGPFVQKILKFLRTQLMEHAEQSKAEAMRSVDRLNNELQNLERSEKEKIRQIKIMQTNKNQASIPCAHKDYVEHLVKMGLNSYISSITEGKEPILVLKDLLESYLSTELMSQNIQLKDISPTTFDDETQSPSPTSSWEYANTMRFIVDTPLLPKMAQGIDNLVEIVEGYNDVVDTLIDTISKYGISHVNDDVEGSVGMAFQKAMLQGFGSIPMPKELEERISKAGILIKGVK